MVQGCRVEVFRVLGVQDFRVQGWGKVGLQDLARQGWLNVHYLPETHLWKRLYRQTAVWQMLSHKPSISTSGPVDLRMLIHP